MAPAVFVSGRVLILATLAGAVTSFGSGRPIQAKVELATVTPFDSKRQSKAPTNLA